MMKWQRMGVVCGTALTTMAFTVMLAAPRGVDAVGAASVKPVIAQPKLESQGCVFELKTDKEDYKPGDRPVLEIVAANPSPQTAAATVWITILESAPSSPMSRMIVMPKVLWFHECRVRLKPGERKTIGVAVEVDLPEGKEISINLSDLKQEIMTKDLGVRGDLEKNSRQSPADRKPETEQQK
jgi:hypothetical protein